MVVEENEISLSTIHFKKENFKTLHILFINEKEETDNWLESEGVCTGLSEHLESIIERVFQDHNEDEKEDIKNTVIEYFLLCMLDIRSLPHDTQKLLDLFGKIEEAFERKPRE